MKHSVDTMLSTLPVGIYMAFYEGVEKTGMTPQLEHAAAVLPCLLSFSPQTIECWMKALGEKDGSSESFDPEGASNNYEAQEITYHKY
jgi:hypothetical protein